MEGDAARLRKGLLDERLSVNPADAGPDDSKERQHAQWSARDDNADGCVHVVRGT